MTALKDVYTSTGAKLTWNAEAMQGLRSGRPRVITCHIMPTDRCSHSCAFCSVGQRAGDVLPLSSITGFLDILLKHGLKSVIVSGGGNPILYRCPESGKTFNDLIEEVSRRRLRIGLITDGMPMREWNDARGFSERGMRRSWKSVWPETLDKLTWVRISMAGLDHEEGEVFVPDVDPTKTTLGFSYVAHDIFFDPGEKFHGKVSNPLDIVSKEGVRSWMFHERVEKLTEQLTHYAKTYSPKYERLLPNCLEKDKIAERCKTLQVMADRVNEEAGKTVAFVQYKPPQPPEACYMGFVHPVLSTDGLVYPCDSVTLAVAELGYSQGRSEHRFASPWAICRWDEIGDLFDGTVRSLIKNPEEICCGCVFWQQNAILKGVVDGTADITPPFEEPEHSSFV